MHTITYSRRTVLTLSGTVAVGVAGCMSTGGNEEDGVDPDGQSNDLSGATSDEQDDPNDQSGSDDTEENGSDVDDPYPDAGEECDIERGEWKAAGDPINITITIEERPDNIAQYCGLAAADAAIEVLGDELDIDVSELDGLYSVYSYDGEHRARVSMRYTSHWGDVSNCHADVFDPEQFRKALPATVTVTLEIEAKEESRVFEFDITLESGGLYLG